MKFQSEKKELWRYASKNLATPVRGTSRQQPLPYRLPHQRIPQSRDFVMMTQCPQQPSLLRCYDGYGENSAGSATTMSTLRQENVNTPPPPYSSLPELDCFLNTTMSNYCPTFAQHQTYPIYGEIENSVSVTDSDTGYSLKHSPRRDGCNYVNTGDTMCEDGHKNLKETSTSSGYQLSASLQKKLRRMSPQPKTSSKLQVVSISTTSTISPTVSFAATAAKILRNCCGGTFGSSSSVTVSSSNTNTHKNNVTINTCSKLNYERSKLGINQLANKSNNYLPEQYFSTLMKQLKTSQISSLLKAVKSRHDQIIPIMPATSTNDPTSSQQRCVASYQINCILIRRAEILGEEPYVITCRLFFWRDLNNASQLKSLPLCPNERDPVYVCCNPLHWCRILETEIAPNLYQNKRINKIKDICCSPKWCEVAYWEMTQRVGERFPADKPIINIFCDKIYTTTGDDKNEMCLKELIEKRTTPSPHDVQYTRQKIGFGITLSKESDGVWLYNRSIVPIFVYSPTLTESWYRVCRVDPGDCLKAFDKYRARSLVHTTQFPYVQTGPIDKFSMRISFGKGWGCSYKRPDITLCPCWLEVLFKPPR